MRARQLKNQNKLGRHIKEILAYMQSLNFKDVTIVENNHIKISWTYNGRRCMVSCSKTPTNHDYVVSNVKHDIKKALRSCELTR